MGAQDTVDILSGALGANQQSMVPSDVQQKLNILDAGANGKLPDAPPAPAKKPPFGPGYLSGLGNKITQGLTFGAGDEIVSGMMGATDYGVGKIKEAFGGGPGPSFNDAYTRSLGEMRGELADYGKRNPVASTVGETAGGVFSPLGVAAAKGMSAVLGPAESFLGSVFRGGATGATLGGTGGFLSGEGGLDNRLDSGKEGAKWGASFGAAIPFVGAGINAFKPASNLPVDRARNLIVDALQKDGMTAEQAAARWESMLAQGFKPEMAFEMGGENLKNLAKGAALSPGNFQQRSKQALDARMKGQQGRIEGDVKTNLSPNDDFYGSLDALKTQRSTAAEPLYDAAYAAGEGRWSPRAQQLVDDPLVRQGVNKGLEIIRLEKLGKGEPFDPKQWGIKGFDPNGGPIVAEGPNIRLLDAAKRGIDEILNESRDNFGNIPKTQRNSALDSVRRAIIGQLDDLTEGAHATARKAWSGPSQSMNAMEMGRGALREDAELTAQAIQKLGDGDKEFFRAGLARAIMDKVQGTSDTGDAVRKIFGTPGIRNRLAAAFPDESAFNSFAASMEREASMYANAQQVMPTRGSQTAGRLAAQEGVLSDKNVNIAQAAGDLAMNKWNPFAWLRMARAITGPGSKGLDPQVNAALSDKLLASGQGGPAMFRSLPNQMPPMFPTPNYGLLGELSAPASQAPRGLLGY